MLLIYDLDGGLWVLAPGSRFAPAMPQLTRGDTIWAAFSPWSAADEGVESHWRVEVGTDSTNGPGGVVRPANYADGTNEVVLHRIS